MYIIITAVFYLNSLVIIVDESKGCLYKVSIQENKTSKGQKRARTENELPVQMSVFQWMTPAILAINASPVMVKPSKKVTPYGSWVSKYVQNPFGVRLKEHQNLKKTPPKHLRTSKNGYEARRISTNNIYHHKTSKGNKGKDLR